MAQLTAAAKRDLAEIRNGKHPDLRYGPYTQLLEAGYITGSQDNYRFVGNANNSEWAGLHRRGNR